MLREQALIATLALSLALAFACGLLAVRLRLPALVGYLVAGIALGPHTPGVVADVHLAPQLADIGVMLLLFSVGTHFSLRQLLAVKSIAVPGALAQIVVATALGALAARLWGWPFGAGIVFGLALSVASTVVLLRALEERGTLATQDGQIAVGWLIVEDLVTVIALVLLPPLAGVLAVQPPLGVATADVLVRALAITLTKVAAFAALMLIVGSRIFPWILARAARTNSRELFTLGTVALALGVAYGASKLFGVSVGLGAFFAGMVISRSDHRAHAAGYAQPVRDIFAALFFVAVGMLFEPLVLVQRPWEVLLVLGIIVVGKAFAAFALVLLLGRPLSTALLIAAALAQIGEFSFILAVMGVDLKVLPPQGESYIVAGALISIALNPVFFALVARLGRTGPVAPAARRAPPQN